MQLGEHEQCEDHLARAMASRNLKSIDELLPGGVAKQAGVAPANMSFKRTACGSHCCGSKASGGHCRRSVEARFLDAFSEAQRAFRAEQLAKDRGVQGEAEQSRWRHALVESCAPQSTVNRITAASSSSIVLGTASGCSRPVHLRADCSRRTWARTSMARRSASGFVVWSVR